MSATTAKANVNLRRGAQPSILWYLMAHREISIYACDTSDDDRSSDSDTPPARVPRWNAKVRPGTVEPQGEFWRIMKLVKYLASGDQCVTATALTCLADFDYTIKPTQKILVENNALEIFVNILEVDDLRCKIGAMTIISQLAQDHHMRTFFSELGIIPLLVVLCNHPCKQLQKQTITTLALFAKIRQTRTIVRKCDGIKLLLDVVDSIPNSEVWKKPIEGQNISEDYTYNSIVQALNALWELSKSPKIRRILQNSGLLPIICRLIRFKDSNITLPALGILTLCSSLPLFRDGLERFGVILYIIKNLSSSDIVRKILACRASFKCLASEVSRAQFYKHGGLDSLVEILKDESQWREYKLIKYCMASLWRCSLHDESLEYLNGKSLLGSLSQLIQHKQILVGTYAGNILGELTKIPKNRDMFMKLGGMKLLVDLIDSHTEEDYLASIAKVVEHCSKYSDCAKELTHYGALRTVWRLLKCDSPRTKANAAWALVDLIKAVEDAGEEVRSYIGGMAKLIDTLNSSDEEVNAAGLAATASVAKDSENLEILNEYGILKKICTLSNTENDMLREQVGVCVAVCANDKRNIFKFGELGVTQNLINYLHSESLPVKTTATFALWKLSQEPVNCIILHRNGVVPLMLEFAAQPCQELQVAAAGVMTNVRGMAHEADHIQAIGEVLEAGTRMQKAYVSRSQLFKEETPE